MTGVLIKREIWRCTATFTKKACDDRGRDCRDAAVSQGTVIVSHHQKLGRGQEGSFPRD